MQPNKSNEDIDLLKIIFKEDEPLGPTHIEDNVRFVDELLIKENLPFKRLYQNPHFLVGRKGSGKSSLLYSAYLDDRSISLELPSSEVFKQVILLINENVDEYTTVEQVESIWSFAIWASIAARIIKYAKEKEYDSEQVKILIKFADGLNINVYDPPFIIIFNALNYIKENKQSKLSFELAARYSSFNNITTSDVEIAVGRILKQFDIELRVLVDSMEEYKLNTFGAMPAISGFIRFIGQFKSFSSNVYIQCALPTEVYFPIIEKISSNPAKDFSRIELVQWTARELLYLAARRLSVFIKLKAPDVYSKNIAPIENLEGRKFSKPFWALILPESIENGLGVKEGSEAYIVRHTQLSPRHIILYFNEIVRRGIKYVLAGERIPKEIVINAIKDSENRLCDDVFAGWLSNYSFEAVDYKYHGYPHAKDLCRTLLLYLPHKFRFNDFEKIYKKYVKNSLTNIADAEDAIKLLTELGIVGKVVDSGHRSDRYITAEFEYALPAHLIYSYNSEFCLHPAFIGTFGSKENYPDPPFAIYPIGSDPEESDYRNFGG